jgi:LuxR family maltose regulon positive regulatory protein
VLAWVSLDEGDGDLRAFLRTLVGAVQAVEPSFSSDVLSLLNLAELPPTFALAAQLAEALDEVPGGIVVVLDDYHLVQHPGVDELLGRLLTRVGESTHLVVSSRDEPGLPAATLRARGELLEIRLDQLTFTADEAHDFLVSACSGSDMMADIGPVVERSVGWPAGLRLAALALTDRIEGARPGADHRARGAQYAREFLVNDVLAAQPSEVRELLLRASVLDRFCAPLLDALLADADVPARGSARLEDLKRRNLFITVQDTEGNWCRFHDLFRDALRHELGARHGPVMMAHLHQRASDWFAGQGLIEEAVKYALAGGNPGHAVRLVESGLRPLLDREDDPGLLEQWLRLLPPEIADADPSILIARGWLAAFRNRLGDLPPLLRAVETLLDADTTIDESRREALRGLTGVLWAYARSRTGHDLDEILATIASALARLPKTWTAARGHAEHIRVTSLARVGRDAEALSWVEANRADLTHADGPRLALLLRSEGAVHIWSLRTADLARTAREMHALGREGRLPFTTTWGDFFAGFASYGWNELGEARDQFEAAARHRANVGIAVALDSVLGLAVTLQALGDEDAADSWLSDLAGLLADLGNQGTTNLLHSCQARIAIARDDLDEASRLMRLVRGDEASAFPSFIEVPLVTRIRWLLLQGTRSSLDEANALVERLHLQSSRAGHLLGRTRVRTLEALVSQTRGDTDGALTILRDVMTATRPGGLLRFFVDFGPPMQRLLVELERQTSLTDPYLTQVLAAFPATTGPVGTAVPSRRGADAGTVDALTWREIEVLKLLDGRLSNKEIARALHISSETVKKHTGNIYQKLQVGSRREAVSRAHGLGLLRIVPRSDDE